MSRRSDDLEKMRDLVRRFAQGDMSHEKFSAAWAECDTSVLDEPIEDIIPTKEVSPSPRALETGRKIRAL